MNIILVWHATMALAVTNVVAGNNSSNHAAAIISWIRSEGGFYNDKLETRRIDRNDPQSSYGIFATDYLEANELLFVIPTTVLFQSGEVDEAPAALNCDTVHSLVKEMRLGDKSKYAPYINFLLDTQPARSPSVWSDAGKNLFLQVLGEDQDGDQSLPPYEPIDWITADWHQGCEGSDDPLEEHAAILVVQLSWDELLIPLFDMVRHRNGKWQNCENDNSIRNGENIKVRASRAIEAGEEIYTSQNLCKECGARLTNYGTAEILRDYGILENYPQRWIFQGQEVAFEIDEIYDNAGEGTGRVMWTKWIENKPSSSGVNWLEEEFQRLKHIGETIMSHDQWKTIPEKEWNLIVEYHKAMMLGMSLAIEEAGEDEFKCLEGGTCQLSLTRYVNLHDKTEGFDEDEYESHPCDVNKTFGVFSDGTYKILEDFKTQYQHAIFSKDPKNKDTCLELDDIVQICGSYRPHYHEMMIHYAARFLKDIKRVLFVGGGDSMLLHETLKYQNLELVVGLELDQKITRQSFKHFGTQPHFDDERVQWWFGDASKTLLMLPTEYFGSFDLILVDLSETVMSFKVTEGLDIMEALTLLLKPDGIFVKNELYHEQMSSMFQYALQMHFYDTPVICSQAMILGSNKIDFISRDLTDHNVDTLFLEPLDEIEDTFELFHDYRKNSTAMQLCKEGQDKERDSVQQIRSPGILMIVEAEQATAELQSPHVLKDKLIGALQKQDISVVSTIVSKSTVKSSIVVIILQEGYVVIRSFPEHKYVALDIHLWSNFRKHENIKKALIKAVGSGTGSSSSFRIVAGGMFGLSTWQSDEKQRGPEFSKDCDRRDEPPIHDNILQQSTTDIVLKKMMALSDDNRMIVVVVCGEEKETCRSIDLLESIEKVLKVIPLHCTGIKDINEYTKDSTESMLRCEQHITKILKTEVGEGKGLSSIILDPRANDAIARIALRVFNSAIIRSSRMLQKPSVFVISTRTENIWQRNFVRRFQEDIFYFEPVFNAEVHFRSSVASFELDVTSRNENFIQTMKNVLQGIESQSGLKSEIRNIAGGMWVDQPDFEPSQFFSPEDYDTSYPLEQWKSQKPLGHQIIFQLQSHEKVYSAPMVLKALEVALATVAHSSFTSGELPVIQKITDIGLGCVVVALWSGGSAIVLWDGNLHVDLNLFLFEENVKWANDFKLTFNAELPALETVLYDEQPRGTGRVVNFRRDLNPRSEPHWV